MKSIDELLRELTDAEKAALVCGTHFSDTVALPERGIPRVSLVDGPHGLRKQSEKKDMLGMNASIRTTCFPTAATMASSWDRELVEREAAAIGEECAENDVQVLLGPGINIKRNPLCGRNFEYYSEDPLLTGQMGSAFVRGLQSEGVGASVKHFALNDTETCRMTTDAVVDERAMREIYLKAFRMIVRDAQPWTIMESYNKINGVWSSENRWLLTELLRGEWGFEGLVMSDWGAGRDRAVCLRAGLDLEMPGDIAESRRRILDALESGELDRAELDTAVRRVLELVGKGDAGRREGFVYDRDAHNLLAREVAESGAVLMQNDGMLPLARGIKLAAVGALAKTMRYQGAGSSLINPNMLDSPLERLAEYADVKYAKGYDLYDDAPSERLINEALRAVEGCDVIVAFLGLTARHECEGFDRDDMRLPENQLALIERLIGLGKPVAVALFGGSPVELPFAPRVGAILNMYLPGQSGGSACARLLFGLANPSGKLAETWAEKYSDYVSSAWFPEGPLSVEYRESIYVGYRWFDKAGIKPAFPFGHGLSYTKFSYGEPKLERSGERVTVTVPVSNAGARAGAEIVQLYAGKAQTDVFREVKRLVAFEKLSIEPGAAREFRLSFELTELAYWSVGAHRFAVEPGEYTLYVGASSADVRAELTIEVGDVRGSGAVPEGGLGVAGAACGTEVGDVSGSGAVPEDGSGVVSDGRKRYPSYYEPKRGFKPGDGEFAELLGYNPQEKARPARPFTLDSSFEELQGSFVGRFFMRAALAIYGRHYRKAAKLPEDHPDRHRRMMNSYFYMRLVPKQSIRCMAMASGGLLTPEMARGLVAMANGRTWRGLGGILRGLRHRKG